MSYKCKNMEGCHMYNLLTTSVRIIQLQPFLTSYCEDPLNCLQCERYKIIDRGKEPPADLLPNGKKLTA